MSYAQGGLISYTETITLDADQNTVSHSWPAAFPNEQYFLSIRAWHEEIMDGKTVQIQNGVYDFSKSSTGFSLNLKTPGGKLTYFAFDLSGTNSHIQSFVATEGQTNFTLNHTPTEASVWLNGLLQFPGVWSTDGSDIVLASAATAGDQVGVYYKEGESSQGGTDPTEYTLNVSEIYQNEANATNTGEIEKESETYADGTTVNLATDFPHTGDLFLGYTLNGDGTNPSMSLDITITQDITVYAVFDYTSQSSSTLSDGVIAAYDFNETNGTQLLDGSGNNLNGAINGANINQLALLDKAYLFDGVDDYISLETVSESLKPDTEISMSAWIKTTDDYGIIARYRLYGWSLFIHDSDIRFSANYDATSTSVQVRYGTGISDGNWHFVCATMKSGEQKLYVDGVLRDSEAITYTSIFYGSGWAAIGRDGDYAGNHFSGSLDQMVIWDKALTADDISELYNSGGGNPYPFDGSSTPTNYTLTVTEKYLNNAAENNPGSIDNDTQDYAEGTVVALTNDFPNEGDHFEGYTINSEGINPDMSLNITLTQDVTVYAVYDYTSQPSSTLLNGLVSAYEFEETSGTILTDPPTRASLLDSCAPT